MKKVIVTISLVVLGFTAQAHVEPKQTEDRLIALISNYKAYEAEKREASSKENVTLSVSIAGCGLAITALFGFMGKKKTES